MTLSGQINAYVYKKKKKEFEQGNQKLSYYRLILDVNDEVDEIPCSEEVYVKVQAGKQNALVWQYNTKTEKNAFKIVDAVSTPTPQNK